MLQCFQGNPIRAGPARGAGSSTAEPMCLQSLCCCTHHYKGAKLCPLICIYTSHRNRERNSFVSSVWPLENYTHLLQAIFPHKDHFSVRWFNVFNFNDLAKESFWGLYQATAIISCLINIGLKSVEGTNTCIRKTKMKGHCQIPSLSLC